MRRRRDVLEVAAGAVVDAADADAGLVGELGGDVLDHRLRDRVAALIRNRSRALTPHRQESRAATAAEGYRGECALET